MTLLHPENVGAKTSLTSYVDQASLLLDPRVSESTRKAWVEALRRAYQQQETEVAAGRERAFTPPPIEQLYRQIIALYRYNWLAQGQALRLPTAGHYHEEAQALLAENTPYVMRKAWLKSLAQAYRQQAAAADLARQGKTMPPVLYKGDNWQDLSEAAKRDYLERLAQAIEKKSEDKQGSLQVIQGCSDLWKKAVLEERAEIVSRYQQEAESLLGEDTPAVIRRAWIHDLARNYRHQEKSLADRTICWEKAPAMYGGDICVKGSEFQQQHLSSYAGWLETAAQKWEDFGEIISLCQLEWQSQKTVLEAKISLCGKRFFREKSFQPNFYSLLY